MAISPDHQRQIGKNLQDEQTAHKMGKSLFLLTNKSVSDKVILFQETISTCVKNRVVNSMGGGGYKIFFCVRVPRRVVNPVVALNAAFVIIKPLPIQEWTLTQCHLLDYNNGDF
jgi:hypothetical protein